MHFKGFKWNLVMVIGLGTFITSFDSSAVSSILPLIIHAFHSSPQSGKWVITLYLLSISSLLLLSGRLGDTFGYRRLFLSGLMITFLGALSCALSTSIYMLAFSRIFEGTGIVLIAANGTALITVYSDHENRSQVLGTLSSAAYLGLTAGTSFAGWLTGHFGWRIIFVVVLSLAALAISLSIKTLPKDQSGANADPVSIRETVFLTLALIGLVLGLNWSGSLGWHSKIVLYLLTGAFISIVLALPWKRTGQIKLFFNHSVAVASVASLFTYIGIYGVTFILPFYLLDARSVSPANMGLLLAVRPLVTAIVAPIGGTMADRYGLLNIMMLGLSVLFFAFLIGIRTNDGPAISYIAIFSVLAGLGMGLFLPANHSLIMGSAGANYKATASGIISLTRNIGMLLGVSIAASFFTTYRESIHHTGNAINLIMQSIFSLTLITTGIALLTITISHMIVLPKFNKQNV